MARGTRRSGSLKGGRSKVARRGHGGPRLSRNLGSFAARAPYGKGTPSIKRKDVYRALRREGASKEKAARIANATANGTIDRKRGRRGPLSRARR